MGAKDTVMSRDNIGLIVSEIHKEKDESLAQWNWSVWREIAQAQAEISFKAGQLNGYEAGFSDGQNYSFTANKTIQSIKDEAKRAGIREVVEWINRQNTLKLKSLKDTPEWFKHCGLLIPMDTWQAKLKEWGIE